MCWDFCLDPYLHAPEGDIGLCPGCRTPIVVEMNEDSDADPQVLVVKPSITIATKVGAREVTIKSRRGVWAVHCSTDLPQRWNVTHIPSGHAAVSGHNEADATKIFDMLATHFPRWKLETELGGSIDCQDEVGKLLNEAVALAHKGDLPREPAPLTEWRCRACGQRTMIDAPRLEVQPICPCGRTLERIDS